MALWSRMASSLGPWSSLGVTTRALLVAYAAYVPGAWLLGTAPGEIEYERAEAALPEGALQAATAVRRASDELLVVELGPGPDALAVVDLGRATEGGLEHAIVAQLPAPGRIHAAVRREDGLHLLTESDDGQRHLARVPLDGGTPSVTEADPRALWPLPDGSAMGHGLTDFLVYEQWALHPSGRPALVSGHLALVRVAQGQPAPDGLWPELPDSSPDDLMVLDAENAEPLGWLDTVRIVDVTVAPSVPGFLTLPEAFPSLVTCDEAGCREHTVHIRTKSHPILHLDHRDAVDRIAACTPTELYLYEGHPLEEAVVFLGRAPLSAPCSTLAIVDQTRVLVTHDEAPPVLVRFEGGDR